MEDRPSPQLDDDLINYVRFFFSTIVGRIGAYRFATRVEDAAWLPDSPGEKKQEFAQKLSPLSIVGTHEGGRLECRGTVIFKNALFIMSILVSQNWEMEISNEELLIEDLPVVFGQKVDLLVQR
jgi:hypothetical protein